MNEKLLLERIAALEKRIAELEARPTSHYETHEHHHYPALPPISYPVTPSPWTSPYQPTIFSVADTMAIARAQSDTWAHLR